MTKRKTKKQKIRAASRVESAPSASSQYALPKGYGSEAREPQAKREVSDLAMLSYAWVGKDIRKSLTVSGVIILAFALLYVVL